MRLQTRPLGISLLVHTLVLGLFLFWLLHDSPQKEPVPLKIQIASFSSSVVAAPLPLSSAPHPAQPPKKSLPVPPKKAPPIQRRISSPAVISEPAVSLPAQVQVKAVLPKAIIQETPVVEVQKPAITTVPVPVINVDKEFLDAHLGEIRALLLQNFKYPRMAQKLRMQGEVRVSFSLEKDGSVGSVKVIESSGFDILDDDAVALIYKTASSFPKPSKSVRISVPLSYVLR